MDSIIKILILSALFLLVGCDANANANGEAKNGDENGELNDLDADFDDFSTDGDEDEIGDFDEDLQEAQTGGVVIFSKNGDDSFDSYTILGQGGFFGSSITSLGEKYWSVSAIHESFPPYDFEKNSGRLYIFERGQAPKNIEDSAFTLTHPTQLLNSAFSFSVSEPCDVDGDGFDDIAVSAHLAEINGLFAAGEIVVFYGSELGWQTENSSISNLSEVYLQRADSMGQSLVCGDIDGDGFSDVMAGGQNAGPELEKGGSQGMVAFFKGGAGGLDKNESWVLLPQLLEKAQYFGSGMILQDINNDGIKDLIISGWALKEDENAVNSGGVYIYFGGDDWQNGAGKTLFGNGKTQFGAQIKTVKINNKIFLGVIAAKEGKHGAIHFFDLEDFSEKYRIEAPEVQNIGEKNYFSDFTAFQLNEETTLLVAGGKYFMDYGRIFCAEIRDEKVENLKECPWQPEATTGGFGATVQNVGDINGDGSDEIVVSMPEYIYKF